MVLVGAPATPHPSPNVFNLIMRRRSLAGSMMGGNEIEAAYERMLAGDVNYRFVMDIVTMTA